jgi:hypothetical protein
MKAHVSWVNELAIKDGALDTFKELMEEMVFGTRAPATVPPGAGSRASSSLLGTEEKKQQTNS